MISNTHFFGSLYFILAANRVVQVEINIILLFNIFCVSLVNYLKKIIFFPSRFEAILVNDSMAYFQQLFLI